jgi:hypothetical protein
VRRPKVSSAASMVHGRIYSRCCKKTVAVNYTPPLVIVMRVRRIGLVNIAHTGDLSKGIRGLRDGEEGRHSDCVALSGESPVGSRFM